VVSPDDEADVREFVLQLVGETASPLERELARAAAEAQLDLLRVLTERERLFKILISETSSWVKRVPNVGESLQAIGRLDRYERKAQRRRKKALGALSSARRLPVFG
jgi:hypothetical protein